jgi:hypothetical protein
VPSEKVNFSGQYLHTEKLHVFRTNPNNAWSPNQCPNDRANTHWHDRLCERSTFLIRSLAELAV